jgi:phage anti-repressor protein
MNLILSNWRFILIVLLVGTVIYLAKALKDTQTNLEDAKITIKSLNVGVQQYKNKDSTWNYRLINERQSAVAIKESKDSIIVKLREQLDAAGVKLNNALALGYVKTSITVDTVIKYIPSKEKDSTTILDFSKRPYITNTVTITPQTASNKLIVTNEQFILTNGRRETVDPRKKFFLWRWFQKRHWVLYQDIHNSNPYILTDNAKFITIVDKDGTTKTLKN